MILKQPQVTRDAGAKRQARQGDQRPEGQAGQRSCRSTGLASGAHGLKNISSLTFTSQAGETQVENKLARNRQ